MCFSTLTLTAISIDRFILIVYPTKRPIQKQHALRMIVFNCAVATALSLPMVFKQKLVDYGNFCGQFCTEDWGNDQFGRSTYGWRASSLCLSFVTSKRYFRHSAVLLAICRPAVNNCLLLRDDLHSTGKSKIIRREGTEKGEGEKACIRMF